MPGAGFTVTSAGEARCDRLALKPYWGKLDVRHFREGDGNVGIIRRPVRAIALPGRRRYEKAEGSFHGTVRHTLPLRRSRRLPDDLAGLVEQVDAGGAIRLQTHCS